MSEHHTGVNNKVLRLDLEFSQTEARLRDFIDPRTAVLSVRSFDGEGGDLWQDAIGNLQLRRVWERDRPTLGLNESVLMRLDGMSAPGTKSILAHNDIGGLACRLSDLLAQTKSGVTAVWAAVWMPTYFDAETGRLVKRNAVGPGLDLWRDDLGNIQVRAPAVYANGSFSANIGSVAVEKLRKIPCKRSRSILLRMSNAEYDYLCPVMDDAPDGIALAHPIRRQTLRH